MKTKKSIKKSFFYLYAEKIIIRQVFYFGLSILYEFSFFIKVVSNEGGDS